MQKINLWTSLTFIMLIAVLFISVKGCGFIKPIYKPDPWEYLLWLLLVLHHLASCLRLVILEKQQLVVTDKLSSNIAFPTGDVGTVGEWIVENPAENSIIQQAEVYLEDILISKSTPIYPNQHITSIQLLENIAPGEYEVLAYLNYYDIETKEFLSKAGYKIHLTVK